MVILDFSTPWTMILTLTGGWGRCKKMFDPLSSSSGWWTPPRALKHNNTLSSLVFIWLKNALLCLPPPAQRWIHGREKISFFNGASHKQARQLMKDSRSDCLALRQIKSQRRSAEWADRHKTLLCLHEQRSERSLRLRMQDQRNKWRSISPEEVYSLTGTYRKCWGFNWWYIMSLDADLCSSLMSLQTDGDAF